MTSPFARLFIVTALGGLALAGCASKPAQRSTGHAAGTTTGAPAHATAPAASPHRTSPVHREAAAEQPLPERTGIPVCDDYLASYRGCHRAAGIYAPDQIEGRYQAMRTSLLRDSLDPDIRPQLAARCNSLASQLRQALHGKACEPEQPAAAASSGR
ncbi:hypothetical protein [Fulvimonas soli]|jgi:hypothetical protein|uniref:Uncharacterized protein n=1 Tax=Fulvimonas soli TaxID=155197 RepID=A0A316IN66_9GAMM|nr:hypothetical protein [Fulvimonas soli]PWK91938.1 hypothetical protein C7456_10357 [Fulvimonas soli]TNY26061.1 hypothetical protein BV497_10950 [Fulvimonas soli]